MSVNALLKPRSIEVETAEGNPYSATVTMEPFETGYAHTLGNALRRVLLSSMVGFAPTEAQIAGVVHEYSQIDGVKEDVVDILLNVKGIIFKLENRDEVTITLRKEGEGVVTAADFDLPHDVQILNPEHVIANLSGGKLDMQLKIEKGRGYQPGEHESTLKTTTARARSAASSWMLPSPRSCALPTVLKTHVSNSAPTLTNSS